MRAELRSLDAFREMVAEDLRDHLDADSQDSLGRIGTAVQRLDHLVQQVVRLQRLPRAPVRLAPTPLGRLTEAAVQRLSQACPHARVRVEPRGVTLDASPSFDLERAVEALSALLENAARFQPAGARAPQIDLLVERRGGAVAIQVVDRGLGIAPDDAHRLFELGVRLNRPRDYPGAGIGLYLARRLLEGWACGPVLVASAPGQGSTFEIELRY